MTDPNLTKWFVQTLTGDVNTTIDWRCIHDQRKDLPAHNFRGTFDQIAPTLTDYNNRGYGIFCTINSLKPSTDPTERRTLDHVEFIRAHMLDLDDPITARANYDRAAADGANFAVQTSPGKFHLYWKVQPYVGNEFFTIIQRKLAQYYSGDRSIIDATRVMRVPGFIHAKGEPHVVTVWPLPAVGRSYTFDHMQQALAQVNVVEFMSTRSPLGTPEMAAPSLDWLKFALTLVNPNEMDYGEWMSFTAAFKQAGWTHADEETLFNIWSAWCVQHSANNPGENLKLWNSLKDTEVGWTSIERKTPVKAYLTFGFKDAPPTAQIPPQERQTIPAGVTIPESLSAPAYGEILSEYDCREWFKDCYFVEQHGKVFSKSARFMNATQFNGKFGGKQFIISSVGKLTDEPWKAALRSTCWTIPKVDHIRFLPDRPPFEIVNDELDRPGLNTYIPARIDAAPGDISRFFDWFDRIFPNKGDQKLLFDYMAHCVKYPGYKIQYAPLIQSAEGIGKTVFKLIFAHALGTMYVYSPKAPELVKSGSTFNAWQRGKLMILVDEIKIDERRELIEILKPMITDDRIEIQGKGVDQDMEDNAANWLFFSNFKDAIPIDKNGRRYSIFYSVLQSKADILATGMDKNYFIELFRWLRDGGGLQAITHWLLNYEIERGDLPVSAPDTSSQIEAISISRSPLECVIADCIADGVSGFRGGYVSAVAVINRAKAAGIRQPNVRVVQNCLEKMGLVHVGRGLRAYMQEDPNSRSEIYGTLSSLKVEEYGKAQGYE